MGAVIQREGLGTYGSRQISRKLSTAYTVSIVVIVSSIVLHLLYNS